jgi:hypothetical protein
MRHPRESFPESGDKLSSLSAIACGHRPCLALRVDALTSTTQYPFLDRQLARNREVLNSWFAAAAIAVILILQIPRSFKT